MPGSLTGIRWAASGRTSGDTLGRAQCVSNQATITTTTSVTRTNVTCERGMALPGRYPGAPSAWRARRIHAMPLPSRPSRAAAVM